MVFDFLDIKPIVREACDSLDHRLLLPKKNDKLQIFDEDTHWKVMPPDEKWFVFPKEDVLLLPIENTSAERLAMYLFSEIKVKVKERYNFEFSNFEVEVEETPGQSAIYREERAQ